MKKKVILCLGIVALLSLSGCGFSNACCNNNDYISTTGCCGSSSW